MKATSPVLLLFGSGTSLPSGLPCVRKITHSLFDRNWDGDRDGLVFRSTAESGLHPWVRTPDRATRAFLRLVKSYADRFYAIRSGNEATYEDIYFLCTQFIDGALENPAADGFIREVNENARSLFEGPGAADVGSTYELARRSCRLIQSAVFESLRVSPEIIGLGLFADLARADWVTELNLVTLNHDLLVEQYLQGLGFDVETGFARDGDSFCRFSRERLGRSTRIRMLKLHGSINWHLFSSDSANFVALDDRLRPDDKSLEDGTLAKWRDGPLLLTGVANKELSYGEGIFAEQFFRFHELLQRHSSIVVCGYGFRDYGVNRRLGNWLDEDKKRRLIILHENPGDLKSRASGANYLNVHEWESSKRLVFVPKFPKDLSDLAVIRAWLK